MQVRNLWSIFPLKWVITKQDYYCMFYVQFKRLKLLPFLCCRPNCYNVMTERGKADTKRVSAQYSAAATP